MSTTMGEPVVSALRIYPIKSLCPVSVERLELTSAGIVYDREWAIIDAQGRYVNAKRCLGIHRVRLLSFLPPSTIRLAGRLPESPMDTEVSFDIANDAASAAAWLSRVLGLPGLELRRSSVGGFSDDPRIDGPTIVSEASLAVVASWLGPSPHVDDLLERFRPNIVVRGVPPFWEDAAVPTHNSRGVAIAAGPTARLVGVAPVHRCVVPSRAPASRGAGVAGTAMPGFEAAVVAGRAAALPPWSPAHRIRAVGGYHLATATVIVAPGSLYIGDSLRLGEEIPVAPLVQVREELG